MSGSTKECARGSVASGNSDWYHTPIVEADAADSTLRLQFAVSYSSDSARGIEADGDIFFVVFVIVVFVESRRTEGP